jgi:alkanesulfonate monooxygenase SsuD/methylene tetrahydromethanopterin reductase-like flavin-dependent oxidoreductase (luciferase family)
MHVGAGVRVIRTEGDNRPLKDLYEAGFDRAIFLEQLGFDFVMASEHHFMASQWNPSPLLLLAGIARQTSVINLGTNVLLTPLYHPVRLAEDVAVLDQISNGRVKVLCCGSASVTGEFQTLGVPPESRFGRVWETLEIMRRSYREDAFDFHGKHYDFPNIRMTTKPIQDPFPLWFGGFGPKMVARCAREGYNFYPDVNEQMFVEELKKAGRDPRTVNLGFGGPRGIVHVVATEKEVPAAREAVAAALAARREEYNERGRDLGLTPLGSSWHDARSHETLVGTPDQVLSALEPILSDEVGQLITHFTVDGTPQQLELIAKEMLPTLRSWGRDPA